MEFPDPKVCHSSPHRGLCGPPLHCEPSPSRLTSSSAECHRLVPYGASNAQPGSMRRNDVPWKVHTEDGWQALPSPRLAALRGLLHRQSAHNPSPRPADRLNPVAVESHRLDMRSLAATCRVSPTLSYFLSHPSSLLSQKPTGGPPAKNPFNCQLGRRQPSPVIFPVLSGGTGGESRGPRASKCRRGHPIWHNAPASSPFLCEFFTDQPALSRDFPRVPA
jgi:hypothetical protein